MPRSSRISVALCSYNGSAFLPDQLQSLAQQTRLPDELIVFDDASTDATVEILNRFAASAPFPVSININPKNIGVSENFQHAIAASTGDIIALSDQDDQWLPQKLGRIESEFAQTKDLGFVFTDAEICDNNAKPLGYTLWKSVGFTPALQNRLINGKAFEVILRQNIVTGATMAFSSKFKSLVLPISPRWIHDGWIALLISALAPARIIPEPLIHYRQHTTQSVGALKRTLYQQYQAAKKMNRQVFADHAEMYQVVHDRLATLNGNLSHTGNVLPMLEEKIRHYRTRSAIRLRQRNRLIPSLTELLSLRYRRYSLGWKSFAQDLFL